MSQLSIELRAMLIGRMEVLLGAAQKLLRPDLLQTVQKLASRF